MELVNKIKSAVINFKWFNYQYVLFGLSLFNSQNSRLAFYTDVTFIVQSIQGGYPIIAFLAGGIVGLPILADFIYYLVILVGVIRKLGKDMLSTYYLEKFYEQAIFLEFRALGAVYNVISPYNAEPIANNGFNRLFFPQVVGQSISKSIINSGKAIFLKDIPKIILKIYFLLITSEIDFVFYISLISSISNTINALGTFLQTRPSIITQMDFDKLSFRRFKEVPKLERDFYTNSRNMWNNINIQFRVNFFEY